MPSRSPHAGRVEGRARRRRRERRLRRRTRHARRGVSPWAPTPTQLLLAGMLHLTPGALVMMAAGGLLIYLAVVKDYEPMLLLPIGAGAILANLPLSPLVQPEGMLSILYDMGVGNETVPVADLHRHRRDDRLRATAREPEADAARRGGAVRHLRHADAGARARVHAQPGRLHRHHRRHRRADVDLREQPSRARTARPDHRLRLQLHVAGAADPAAHHAMDDEPARARHPDALHASARSASARACCSRSS